MGERRVVELLGAADRPVEERGQVLPGDLARGLLDPVLGHARAVAVAREEQADEIVERALVPGEPPQLEVEQRADHLALQVVADRRVDRVLVRPVVLDPGVERRVRERLRLPPRRRVEHRERLAEPGEVARARDQPRAAHEHVVVVRGHPLERPEQGGVVLLRVVERDEALRLHPLDVPEVEVLVRGEGEEVLPALRVLQPDARKEQRRRRRVLEPAAAAVGEVDEEQVALEREASEERRLRLDDLLQIRGQPLRVGRRVAPHDHLVRHARRGEGERLVRADLERAVDERVVVGRDERAVLLGQGGERAPALGRDDLDHVPAVPEPLVVEEHRRAVEVAVAAVEVAGADGELVRVDPVAEDDLGARRVDAEAALVDPDDLGGAAVGERGHVLELAGVLADQVAARRPHRERDGERPRLGGEAGLDLEQVRVRAGHRDAVVDLGAHAFNG